MPDEFKEAAEEAGFAAYAPPSYVIIEQGHTFTDQALYCNNEFVLCDLEILASTVADLSKDKPICISYRKLNHYFEVWPDTLAEVFTPTK